MSFHLIQPLAPSTARLVVAWSVHAVALFLACLSGASAAVELAAAGPPVADITAPVTTPPLDGPVSSATVSPVRAGLNSSFSLGPRPFAVRQHDSAARELLDGIVVTPFVFVPFDSSSNRNRQSSGSLGTGGPTVGLDLRYNIVSYWFADVTFYRYLESAKRKPWNGDFSYSFGYDNYHPYTLSLVYSNYQNNHFGSVTGANRAGLDYGTITLGYKFPVPPSLARHVLIDPDQLLMCHVGVNATPRFDLPYGGRDTWKQALTLGCRYPLGKRLFVEATGYAYTRGQQPWDPDYSYSLGLYDYRSSRFSLVYSNYSGNRFPGHVRDGNNGRFVDGGVTLSWIYAF